MRILLSILFTIALLSRAGAAIVADFRNLGFSPDGRHFAFMEYGVQDGSGFPFASIYVIDLERDAWVGPPVRVLLREEAEDLREAMRKALRMAESTLKRAGIDPLLTGRELFHAPPTEGTEPAIVARFVPWRFQLGNPEWTYTLRLSTFPLPGGGCHPDTVEGARGFALDARAGDSGAFVRLYADSRVPASRHCPIAYAVDRVIRFSLSGIEPAASSTRAVVIVRYGFQAFEGLDERYLAVPVRLPELRSRR